MESAINQSCGKVYRQGEFAEFHYYGVYCLVHWKYDDVVFGSADAFALALSRGVKGLHSCYGGRVSGQNSRQGEDFLAVIHFGSRGKKTVTPDLGLFRLERGGDDGSTFGVYNDRDRLCTLTMVTVDNTLSGRSYATARDKWISLVKGYCDQVFGDQLAVGGSSGSEVVSEGRRTPVIDSVACHSERYVAPSDLGPVAEEVGLMDTVSGNVGYSNVPRFYSERSLGVGNRVRKSGRSEQVVRNNGVIVKLERKIEALKKQVCIYQLRNELIKMGSEGDLSDVDFDV